MSRFAPKTLRKMPPATREIARLANETGLGPDPPGQPHQGAGEHGDDGEGVGAGVL